MSVGVARRTDNFSKDFCTSSDGMIPLFKYEDASAFSHDETIALFVEWATLTR